ncbi:sulfate/molybdate ABC transporter ATP-binding protein [Peptostreptococcus sp. D1]|uniref:sulfate/molybdate ABC transporter ATP-binding protein n=1 Tax=Peptostreptococcus sp. D1 TaxID=72304 RepID=UPI0008E051F1|nr:ATP-binding cassette domain-containing protein [Peptostreptococcus sp. D1]SFE77808.1 molybdate transport system ATP-binding protein [Peptostreptococcus sp. D1]
MGLSVEIKSKLNIFEMDISLKTTSNRIGILGASGSGKSMLLKYISGIITPDEGVIELNDELLFDSSKKINIKPQKRNVAYMFQNYALFPTMSVRENIEIIIEGSKKYKAKKASELMKRFCIDNIASKMPRDLSGGQQQRVALARIMAYEPKLILLDEPFSAMDNDLKDKLQMELEEMVADYDGIIIMVSHSRDEIYRFSDELIIIDNGGIVEHGTTKKTFNHPKTIQGAKMVGVSNILPASIDNESMLFIPEMDLKIALDDADEICKNKIRYVGIRDVDFKILSSNENVENVVDVKIEKIYEGIENIKVFFSFKKNSDYSYMYDRSDKVYCIRINKLQDRYDILEGSSLTLSIDKRDLIFIE